MIEITIENTSMRFHTEAGLFSPRGLDAGTKAMLSCASFRAGDKVLDLGCGYGVVGVYAAKLIGGRAVTMADINPRAVRLAAENAAANGVPEIQVVQSDGFREIRESGFTLILSNPPYNSDFSVAKHFIEKGFNRLVLGGRLMMVTKRKLWYQKKLSAIFGGTTVQEVDGYFVFAAEKRSDTYAHKRK